MGSVVHLRNQINNSYFQLKDSVEDKLMLTEEKIKTKLISDVELVQKMTNYHIKTGGTERGRAARDFIFIIFRSGPTWTSTEESHLVPIRL